MACKERLERYLREHRVAFWEHTHALAATSEQLAAITHIPGRLVAKVVVVLADERPVLLVLPSSRRVDLARVRDLLDADEVRLAREDEFAGYFPDCEVGALPPLGQLYGVQVCVDERLSRDEIIVSAAGTHRHAIGLAYQDFARLTRPKVAAFSCRPEDASRGRRHLALVPSTPA
jgi:Ala-tRNA(Pro) deacylase